MVTTSDLWSIVDRNVFMWLFPVLQLFMKRIVYLANCVVLCVVLCRLCCSMYCLCVNVYCTAATGCLPNCS